VSAARVFANLEFTVEDSAGSSRGHLRGDGAQLILMVDDPVRAAAASGGLAHVGGLRGLRTLATRLASQGLVLTIAGRRGPLAHLGATGRGNLRLGRLRDGYPGVLLALLKRRVRRG
jgi:hypothetical protein